MEEMFTLLVIGMVFVIGPLWLIFHYATVWKKSKGLSAEDEATLEELRQLSDKLEDRMQTLERILDDEIPDWRSRRHETL